MYSPCMIQFMRRRNQIEFVFRFKADRSLKCLQYDPYQPMCMVYMTLFGFTVDNGGSDKTEIIGNIWRIHSHKRGVIRILLIMFVAMVCIINVVKASFRLGFFNNSLNNSEYTEMVSYVCDYDSWFVCLILILLNVLRPLFCTLTLG